MFEPEEFPTARDAALEAGRQHLPPPVDREAEKRQLADSLRTLLGQTTDDAAPPDETPGESAPQDAGPEMLGDPEPAEPLPMATSALPADSALGPSGSDAGSPAAPGSLHFERSIVAGSFLSSVSADDPATAPLDTSVYESDLVMRPSVRADILPTALSQAAPGGAPQPPVLAPSAADVDWSEPASAGLIQAPVSPTGDDQGFEVTVGPSIDDPMPDWQQAAGDDTDSPPSDELAGDSSASLNLTGPDGVQSGDAMPSTLEIYLADADEVAVAAAKEWRIACGDRGPVGRRERGRRAVGRTIRTRGHAAVAVPRVCKI